MTLASRLASRQSTLRVLVLLLLGVAAGVARVAGVLAAAYQQTFPSSLLLLLLLLPSNLGPPRLNLFRGIIWSNVKSWLGKRTPSRLKT